MHYFYRPSYDLSRWHITSHIRRSESGLTDCMRKAITDQGYAAQISRGRERTSSRMPALGIQVGVVDFRDQLMVQDHRGTIALLQPCVITEKKQRNDYRITGSRITLVSKLERSPSRPSRRLYRRLPRSCRPAISLDLVPLYRRSGATKSSRVLCGCRNLRF